MFKHQGIWLPDGEKHFPEWMDSSGEVVEGRGTYQIKKWRACLPWIKKWRRAIDVGSHVGFWTIQMEKRFDLVECFEPVKEMRDCWWLNMERRKPGSNVDVVMIPDGVSIWPMALAEFEGSVEMEYDPADSGGTHVRTTSVRSDQPVLARALDSFDFEDVDFVKLDCEGYEDRVLAGAVATLKRCRPCVIVEQKPHKLGPNFGIKGTPACDLLIGLGAKQRAVISGDHIFSWDA